MKEPRCDRKVSWLALSLSDTRFWRRDAGIEDVSDKRCLMDLMDCRFWDAWEMDSGREEEVLTEWEFEIRLYGYRSVCSSVRCELDRALAELELLRDSAYCPVLLCCVDSKEVESAGGVGGL